MTLNLFLWIAQIILAGLFGFAGFIKTFWPIPRLAGMLEWPGQLPVWLTRFIGIAEGLGAIGIILPLLAGILVWLTPLAALGFVVVQVIAIGFHAYRNEMAKSLPINLLLLALSAFVLWGRWDLFTG